MILRRFMQHVREQNWLAVCIDILVVFGSVVLASQISEGISRSRAEQQLRSELETVASELRASVEDAEDYALRNKGVMAGIRAGLEVLDGKSPGLINERFVLFAMSVSGNPKVLPRRAEALRELQNTGRLKDVPYPELRGIFTELLYLARRAPLDHRRILRYLSAEDKLRDADYVQRRLRLDAETGFWGGSPIVSMDWQAAREDSGLRRQLLDAHMVQSLLAVENEKWAAVGREALQLLSERGFTGGANWWTDNKERFNKQYAAWEGWLSEDEMAFWEDGFSDSAGETAEQ